MKEVKKDAFLPTGFTIDGYKIETKLADGGCGPVFTAQELETGESVAIKFGTSVSKDYFTKEAAIHQQVDQLNNPHIVKYKGNGTVIQNKKREAVEIPYVVTSLAKKSLFGEIATKGRLSFPEASKVVKQVANALRAIHKEGLVHADIKPDNILLTSDETVVICDFGHASLSPKEEEREVMISPFHSAPEQWRGLAVSTSDTYSLGLVLYEGLVGEELLKRPIRKLPLTMIEKEKHDRFIDKRLDLAPPSLRQPLKQVLAWDPAYRLTPREFAIDIELRASEVADDKKRKASKKRFFNF